MKNKKTSLATFNAKAKAKRLMPTIALDKIRGGDSSSCDNSSHSFTTDGWADLG